MPTQEELWAELEAAGEDTVRARLATHVYGEVGNKHALVEEWLRRKDQSRFDAASLEQRRNARNAKNAAIIAAIAAMLAAIVSIITLILRIS